MKYKKELALSIACFLLSFLCFMVWNQERDENLAAKISPAVLRLHVIGASNSDQDQQVKLKVKSYVVEQLARWNASSKEELVNEIQKHQAELTRGIEAYAASDLGVATMQRFAEGIGELGSVDKQPKLEGRQILMFMSPKAAK